MVELLFFSELGRSLAGPWGRRAWRCPVGSGSGDWGVSVGLRRRSELAFDRLCAVCEPAWAVVARPQLGFRGGRWRRSLSGGLSEPGLRAIVIFALIHRPILPLSFLSRSETR
jgi:hypothetical protein